MVASTLLESKPARTAQETLFMPKVAEKKAAGSPGAKGPVAIRKSTAPRETAETMAPKQKEIAVSEFFAKNRHLLGFDNPRKALLTTVKEAVDNSLDACEEGGILPEIWIKIEALNGGSKAAAPPASDNPKSKIKNQKSAEQPTLLPTTDAVLSPTLANATRFRVTVRDNGPGIVKAQIPNVFGRLLYGSKFHRLRMSRGQQGIGISAAGMYGLLTTGQSVEIVSRTGKKKPAHRFELQMDTQKNRPEIITDEELQTWSVENFPHSGNWQLTTGNSLEMEHGTEVSITLEARFQRGRASVDEYLEQTAIANPHALFHWIAPDGVVRDFPREVHEVPESPEAIKPHPYGVELGVLIRMLKDTEHAHLGAFLQDEFSRVSHKVAAEIVEKAGLTMNTWCAQVAREEADRLHKAINETKIMAPPTDCLVPIGPQQILKGLLKEIKAEFYTAETREPAVYRGNPFQIEVGLAFGGNLPAEDSARIIRFANRVPLLYQPSSCAITKSVIDTNWRNYGMTQPRSSLPEGSLVIFVHMASVWVPFTSESKEAIADYDEIRKEIKLAIQECGRKLNTYIRRRQRIAREGQRRHVFERYIGEVVAACAKMTKVDEKKLYNDLQSVSKSRTATADLQFDEDGNPIKPTPNAGRLGGDENVVVIEANANDAAVADEADDATVSTGSTATKVNGLFDDKDIEAA
jgi:DNA topoisomerase-6 subunit B